jgi:hypothetical protein
MSRGRQIGMLGILLAVFLVGIALLPAKSPPAANTPAPAKPSAAAPATPPGLGSQIATTIANPQLATAFPGLNAPLLATQVAGIDRNQAATAITISGLLQNGACLNIKGVVMPNGGKVYYLPESYYYESAAIDKTKGDQYFCTAAEALAAGFTPGK